MATTLLIFAIVAVTASKVCALEVECGTVNVTQGLITNRDTTARGEWPFLAALYLAETETFFCGGTLISPKHVLTAAHCIRPLQSNNELRAGDIVVLLGAYNLTSKIESGVQRRDVDQIYIHPGWRPYSDKYDADLAILYLNEIVTFTNYIRPVCLPAHYIVLDNVTGSVVGWGLTGTNTVSNKEFIKQAYVTALNGVFCLTENPDVAILSSTRTFCGQSANGMANNGELGSGFYVLSGSSWMQYGIVSAMRSNATGHVDSNTIVVYTNVLKFTNWIIDIMSQSGAAVDEAKTNVETKINLKCEFENGGGWNYGCWVDNLDIQSDNIAVASFTGTHLNGNTDEDVEWIVFRSRRMFFIPSQVGLIFKNLTKLWVRENLSTKRIKRIDFQGLEKLDFIAIQENDFSTLDYDCLRDLQLLQTFSLVGNNLTQIDSRTFEKNVKLREVNLGTNKLEVLPRHIFTNNLLLEVVILSHNYLKIIDEKTFQTNVQLREVYLSWNKLEVLPRHLFTYNFRLERVELRDNSLKIIEIDFTTFSSIKKIDLSRNNCIAANYDRDDPASRNLTEFQNIITLNCSSAIL